MSIKLNTLLAKNQSAQPVFAQAIAEQTNVFARQQGKFKGRYNTHVGKNDFPSDASKNKNERVVTTVDEQLKYLEDTIIPYLQDIFKVEHTNSIGAPMVELVVEGKSFGKLTAIELMKLKNILNAPQLLSMYTAIPVRSDGQIWNKCEDDEDYASRGIYETPIIEEVTRTTLKEPYILRDPNIDPNVPNPNYRPQMVTKDTTIETGDATRQEFSGEWTQERKAYLLRRLSLLRQAVIQALSDVNDASVANPEFCIKSIMHYIHGEIIGR